MPQPGPIRTTPSDPWCSVRPVHKESSLIFCWSTFAKSDLLLYHPFDLARSRSRSFIPFFFLFLSFFSLEETCWERARRPNSSCSCAGRHVSTGPNCGPWRHAYTPCVLAISTLVAFCLLFPPPAIPRRKGQLPGGPRACGSGPAAGS
jgi:hypothetical protein